MCNEPDGEVIISCEAFRLRCGAYNLTEVDTITCTFVPDSISNKLVDYIERNKNLTFDSFLVR